MSAVRVRDAILDNPREYYLGSNFRVLGLTGLSGIDHGKHWGVYPAVPFPIGWNQDFDEKPIPKSNQLRLRVAKLPSRDLKTSVNSTKNVNAIFKMPV